MSNLTKLVLTDEEREEVKANPYAVASEQAWSTSADIISITSANGGVLNGRLIAIEVEKAMKKVRDDLSEFYENA